MQHVPDYNTAGATSTRLDVLVQDLETFASRSSYEAEYVKDLALSLRSLDAEDAVDRATTDMSHLVEHLDTCDALVSKIYDAIISALETAPATNPRALTILAKSGALPRMSPMVLLSWLNHHHHIAHENHRDWRDAIVGYGIAITSAQRATRLLHALSLGPDALNNEIVNYGHQKWNPREHPEWLLQEIEGNVMIRPAQYQIASKMIHPPANRNSVMQLNMGEGKSSVIVPMVATDLATPNRLIRVMVLKAQSKQMRDMLLAKLGALCGRAIRQIPFARSLKIDNADADALQKFVRDCMLKGDILLLQPEHTLSLQLMAIECCQTSGRESIGQSLLRTLDFFDRSSRDIGKCYARCSCGQVAEMLTRVQWTKATTSSRLSLSSSTLWAASIPSSLAHSGGCASKRYSALSKKRQGM